MLRIFLAESGVLLQFELVLQYIICDLLFVIIYFITQGNLRTLFIVLIFFLEDKFGYVRTFPNVDLLIDSKRCFEFK